MILLKDISYIPDNPDIYENLTGLQYVNFISDLYEVNNAIWEEKIEYFSNMFDMKDFLKDVILFYSIGIK